MSIEDQALEQGEDLSSTLTAKLVLENIQDAKKHFKDWNTLCDEVDRAYADLKLLNDSMRPGANEATNDAEFNLFWSNIQVMGPSIYAKAPIPVVAPRFNDRRPLYRTSAELLERCAIVDFDRSDINSVMIDIRDDLLLTSRGAAWVRYEGKEDSDTHSERVVADWLYRRDFLHGPGRTWKLVTWVARRGWLTAEQFADRFDVTKQEALEFKGACKDKWVNDEYDQYVDNDLIPVWEYWDKSARKVYWVVEGHEDLLEEDDPYLSLDGFFPCPQPAYSTLQHNTLIPIPEVLLYKDQLRDINRLTRQIHELVDQLKVLGFYPGGTASISDAVEQATTENQTGVTYIPISDWAAAVSAGKLIEWFPTDQVAATLVQSVELRRQLIDDVYQIMGLSDIMRGTTEAQETATAQSIKAQQGSVRLRHKTNEMIRIARDVIAIAGEIMAEEFSQDTFLEMSQMELPTDDEIKAQIKDIERGAREQLQALEQEATAAIEQGEMAVQEQLMSLEQQSQQALASPEMAGNPQEAEAMQAGLAEQAQAIQAQAQEQAMAAQAQFAEQQQQIIAQAQEQSNKIAQTVTIDQVASFLRDERLRPFVLDIESDSTIYPNEMAEKESRAQFMQVLGSTLQQVSALVAAEPGAASFAGEMIRFAIAPYRAGRSMDSAIDSFIEQIEQRAQNPQPNPELEAMQAELQLQEQRLQLEAQKVEAQVMKVQSDAQAKQAEMQIRMQEAQLRAQEMEGRLMADQAKQGTEVEKAKADLAKTGADIQKIMAEIDKIRADTGKTAVETTLASRNSDIEAARAISDIENNTATTANTIRQSERTVEGQTNGR